VKVAVIPARGGSKRIPRKNIRMFCGKPIIAYSIAAAQESRLFDQIVVSTDDEEIASIARDSGATTPFIRPSEIADDFTGTNAVVKHAVAWFAGRGHDVTHACCIYATAPLIQTHFIQEGYDALIRTDAAFAFSITNFSYPIQRALRIAPDGRVQPFNPGHRLTRSQDLEPAYHDAGQFYWGTARAFLEDTPLFSSQSVGVVLPRLLVQDIDTPEDWEQAELMYFAVTRKSTGI
jgi:pseudaminic acid cytidylyltransferase